MDDTLFDINFKVDSPQVVAVIGRVGSGKSSLIQVRSTFTGFFVVGLPQTTWFLLIRIQTALIQTNILSVAQKYFFCKESHVVCITCKYYRNDPVKYDLNFCSL